MTGRGQLRPRPTLAGSEIGEHRGHGAEVPLRGSPMPEGYESGWEPIETAPKDGTVIALSDGAVTVTGHWSLAANWWEPFPEEGQAALMRPIPPLRFEPTKWTHVSYSPRQ